jgi:thiamine pyrophosphokinase
MKRAFIFANGKVDEPPTILRSIGPDDLIIAADGGIHHSQALGITPHIIIGDFDSLEEEDVSAYERAGVETVRYPRHKDETDLELALQLALKKSVDEVFVIGALGARWDMTIANILLLAYPGFANMRLHLLDGKQEFILLRGKEQVKIHSQVGGPVSLIPLAGDALGVTTHGLEYPLTDESLYFGSPRGVSNICLKDHAQIELGEGLLLIIYNSKGY